MLLSFTGSHLSSVLIFSLMDDVCRDFQKALLVLLPLGTVTGCPVMCNLWSLSLKCLWDMHATEAQTADGYFRMESNSSPSLEIQTGFPRVEGAFASGSLRMPREYTMPMGLDWMAAMLVTGTLGQIGMLCQAWQASGVLLHEGEAGFLKERRMSHSQSSLKLKNSKCE